MSEYESQLLNKDNISKSNLLSLSKKKNNQQIIQQEPPFNKNNYKILTPNKNQINSNFFIYNQLQNKLSSLSSENSKLKSQLVSLKNTITNLETDNMYQKKTIIELNQTQNNVESLKQIILEKEEIIKTLEDRIISEQKKYNEELRKKENKFDYDLIQSKMQYESSKYKIDNYLKVEKYNDALYKKMIEMEEIINNFNKIEEENMNKKKNEYTNKLNKFKKKVIDFLKNEINSNQDFKQQMKLSNSVNDLHIKELVRDIEELSIEVGNLLEEKQELKYKIFCLVNDMKIYRNVINTVVLKNNNLQKRLIKKNLSSPLMNFKQFFNDNSKNKISINKKEVISPENKINKKLDKFSTSLSSLFEKSKNKIIINSPKNLKDENIKNFNGEKFKLNKFNSTSYLNSPKKNDINNNISNVEYYKNKNLYLLIDKQTELMKEKEKYKKYYEYYKEKINLIKEKYTSIFKIYKEELEKIFNEELSKENEDIFININELKNIKFEYEKMNSKQKYFLLIKLIKHISPLVFKEEFNNNIIAENIFNVKEQYILPNNNTKSFCSSTEQNSFDISSKMKKRNLNSTNNNFEKSNILNDFNSTSCLKIVDRKHKKYGSVFRNKNTHKIFMEFKKSIIKMPMSPLKSIPINDFYNGPFSII